MMNRDSDPESKARKDAALVTHWKKEIDGALKREKSFRTESQKIVELYEGEKSNESPFNILYSNTETLAPALYNSTPRPVVQRRFKDEDPLGKMASLAGERSLQYLVDDGLSEYATFDELMKSAVLEALVPGRGVTRFKYDATFEKVEAQRKAESSQEPEKNEGTAEEDGSAEAKVADAEKVKSEIVCGEEVPWDRFLHGYGKKWKDVPWVAYLHFMTKEELQQNFGAIGAKVKVEEQETDTDDDTKKMSEGMGIAKTARVYEIWDKVSRRVIFITDCYPEEPLKNVEDPLNLSGFFNCPKPLQFFARISSQCPVPIYKMYEEQAKELNKVTVRINKIVSAMKVRGFYDGSVENMAQVLSADDNTLIAAENVAAMYDRGGIEKAIWLFPIEKLVGVLQQLYTQRAQIKQVIYEITGIADIMRGSSAASETLGAQEIKNQWGTLRLKRNQKEVARYARDCLRIMLEIAVTKLSEETLKGMTGLPYPTGGEKEKAAEVMGQVQQLAQGQPPPPEVGQQLQQIQKIATELGWPEVLALLRDDVQRSFRIDIETNSTVDAEATEDKQDIAELLNAISQFLNGVSPLVESGSMPFEVASSMLLAIVRRFRFGPEIEDQLKNMKAPTPPPDPKAESDKAKMAMEQQQGQLDMQMKQMDMQNAQQIAQMDMALKQQEHQFKLEELARKREFSQMQFAQKMATIQAQAAAAAAKPKTEPATASA